MALYPGDMVSKQYCKELTMCMFCAAIPAAAAVGAKLNADRIRQPETRRLPIPTLTALAVALLLIGSITYHTLTFRP
jgi:hypothetical protein